MSENVCDWMREVLDRFGKERLEQEVIAMGYMGNGSLNDAGCVELACLRLLWSDGDNHAN